MRRRDFIKAAVGTAAAWPVSSRAESYPSRPITLIVPFAAGGPTDVLARILAEQMRMKLGQTVVIENVTGASGTIAGMRASRATPDGYTITIGHWGSHVLNGAVYSLQYDVLNDFDPVALIGNGPQLIIGRPTLPARDLKELIGWLKDNPNKATAGTAGPGYRPDVRSGHEFVAASARRQREGLCRNVAFATRIGARYPDGG
jgi:tripartite-type tricarboxylate transporter receptor subunit TctC